MQVNSKESNEWRPPLRQGIPIIMAVNKVKKKEFEELDCTHSMLFRGTGLH